MVYKRRAKRSFRKRTRKIRRKARTTLKNKTLNPFSQRYLCKMKYAEVRVVSGPVGGGLVQYNYRLNSIFDPNLTGGGHQPYGSDQLSDLYNRYRVYKVDYAISALNTDGAINYSVIAAIPSNEPLSAIVGVPEIMESPRARYITQAPNASLKVLKGSISLPSLTGRTKAQYMADDRYQALFTDNPQESAVLNIFAGTLSGTNGNGTTGLTNTMNLSISLVYHVECFDVKQQIQS